MNPSKILYELQVLDSDIDKKKENLRQVESHLCENEALLCARSEQVGAIAQIAVIEKQQKELEQQVEDLNAKLRPVKQKLYDGSVRNTKELVNLEQEAAMLSKQVTTREDSLLDLMGAFESARATLDSAGKRLAEVEKSWQEEQGQLLKDQAGLKQEIEAFLTRRTELVSQVEPASIEMYSQLKVKGKGRAVARVEQGRCQGCYISLTVNEWQRVRTAATKVVHCSNCGRILHLE